MFAKGLKEDQIKYQINLIGGDTVITEGSLILSATLFGYKNNKIIKRSDAKLHDDNYDTGYIGDRGIGLTLILISEPTSTARRS